MASVAKKAKMEDAKEVTIEFVASDSGSRPFSALSVSLEASSKQLEVLLKALMKENEDEIEDEDFDSRPFSFYLEGKSNSIEINEDLKSALNKVYVDGERAVPIVFKPQAVFRVKPVTRCCASLPGHSQPVVAASFSGCGSRLASAAGDNTVRFWDLDTETPLFEGKGVHANYVLALAWSPCGNKLASGDKNGRVAIWEAATGTAKATLSGHRAFITALSFEPMHVAEDDDAIGRRLASASKDGDVRVWDTKTSKCLFSLTSHTMSVTCLRWGGLGLIYSASQDRTVKVWRSDDGVLCRTLQGHAHWINVLALNTDHVMRTADFDPSKFDGSRKPRKNRKSKAEERFKNVSQHGELLVSGSDDFTLFLWNPSTDKSPLARMTGHQQLVNDVKFSPDASLIASASFDKSVRLWNGRTGKFVAVLRGHVQAVYQLAWSADSRLLVSGSADSTLKLWSATKKKLQTDLPGHGDEVYAVDWSPDGQRVVSAGKDALLRLWRR